MNESKTTVITFDPFFKLPEIKGKTDAVIARLISVDTDTVKKMRNREDVPFDTIWKNIICHGVPARRYYGGGNRLYNSGKRIGIKPLGSSRGLFLFKGLIFCSHDNLQSNIINYQELPIFVGTAKMLLL